MKKSNLITFFSFCLLQLSGFSQNITNYKIKGNIQNNLQAYFDQVHQTKKSSIETLDHSYNCAIEFSIGQDSSIHDLKFLEIPDAPLNDQAKEYIKKLLETTERKWIATGGKTLPDSRLILLVKLIKNGQDENSRMIEEGKFSEFLLSDVLGRTGSPDLTSPLQDYYIILRF